MPNPVFRLATLSDLPQLVELRVLMQKEVNNPSEKESGSAYVQSVTHYFERNLRNESYVSAVAVVDGKLVSANGLVVYSKPPSVTGGTGQVGYVTNVYTLPEWRGRGIAGELMKLVVEHARSNGVDKLHLGATDSGKGVYKRVGFKPPRFVPLELKL
jgi:GNAT superfamily N-acetyltransferase